jgi:hypothetical protein
MTKHTRISKRSSKRLTLNFKNTSLYRWAVIRADMTRFSLSVPEGMQQLTKAFAAIAFRLPGGNSGVFKLPSLHSYTHEEVTNFRDMSFLGEGWSGERHKAVFGDVYDDSAGYYSRPNDQPESDNDE